VPPARRRWRILLWAVDVLLLAFLAVVLHIAIFGGFELTMGALNIRARTYGNPIVALAALLILRQWLSGTLAGNRRRGPGLITDVVHRFGPLTVWVLLLVAIGLVLTSHVMQGLTAHYYDNPAWSDSPALVTRDREPSLRRAHDAWHPTRYSIEWTGVIYVPADSRYEFSLTSDDGSSLWIGDALVVDNGGVHASAKVVGAVALTRGFHPVRVQYAQHEGSAEFAAAWRRLDPGDDTSSAEEPLSTAILFPEEPGAASFALCRAGHGLVNVGRGVAVPVVGLAFLGVSFWLLARWRAARTSLPSRSALVLHALEKIAAGLVELALIATLLVIFRVALFGPLTLWLGGVELRADTWWAPAIGLIVVLAMRRGLRGSALGGFRLPGFATVRIREWARRLVSAQLGSTRLGGHAKVVMVGVLAGSAVVLAGLAISSQRGLTGRYYREAQWSGDLFATTRDADLNLRRANYDFMDDRYHYSIDWVGVIHIPASREYEFALTSQGRAGLWIDDLVVDALSPHDLRVDSASVRLTQGFHPIRVRYAPTDVRRGAFKAEWRRRPMGPRASQYRLLSSAVLFEKPPGDIAFALFRIQRHFFRTVELALLAGLAGAYLVGCHWLLAGLKNGLKRGLTPRVGEDHVYLALWITLAVVYYLAASTEVLSGCWGYAALRFLGGRRTIAAVLLIVLAVVAYRRFRPRVDAVVMKAQALLYARPAVVLVLAAVAVLVFFGLRNGSVNSDGIAFRWQVPVHAAAGRGAGVIFDEMWESYLHARFWYYTNAAFGWTVRLSYQVASSLAGGLFLVLVWAYARFLFPSAALAFCLLMVSGGYMQLFFGEVENYSFVAVAIVAYCLLSARYLRGLHRLAVPSAMLSLAMTCHLLAGFMGPSLIVLYVVALRRRAYLEVAMGVAAFVGVFLLTMLVLGKPIESLYSGSFATSAMRELTGTAVRTITDAATARPMSRWAWFAFDAYHGNQYSLLALMFPGHLLLVPLLLGGRIKMDAINLHLVAACLGLGFFHFTYRALLPLDGDWNLYAGAAIPLAILVWRNLLEADGLRYRAELTLAWGLLSLVHSYSWIVSNHLFTP
jgi:hypothetical protein